jgi:glutathione-specific gamma-glutamylcyclotransferase
MDDAMWVFGYGSLIWSPGFPFAERHIARLDGWQRSFCMRSIHHRGTPEAMGLVLALDQIAGSACAGVAFRVEPGLEATTLQYLRERELISSAYLEHWLPVSLSTGRTETALAYVVDPHHTQYCGRLPPEDQARIIARAKGDRGTNRDYLFSTARHLTELGISDPDLNWLVARVAELAP